MAEGGFRGKSMRVIALDVAEGYISVNPLFLKKFDKDMVKELYDHLNKALTAHEERKDGLHRPCCPANAEHEASAPAQCHDRPQKHRPGEENTAVEVENRAT